MPRTVIGLTVLIIACAGTNPVEAQTGTRCTFDFEWRSSPGYTMTTPTSGTNHGTGTITCDRPVNGKQPAGVGTLTQDGRYGTGGGDTCFGAGKGNGVHTIEIPVAGGVEVVVSEFTFSTGGRHVPTHGGVKAGSFEGTRFSGTFESRPMEGDCITAPVTRSRVFGEGVLHS